MENSLDLIIDEVVKKNQRDVLFCRHNKGCLYYLNFDSNFWYVECYDDLSFDFYWCLKFENYSDAINCYRSNVGD